jgi:3D (Asp-Asp-Asp) domain-containing protein
MRRSACAVLLALASLAAAPDTMRVKATAYCQSGTTKSGLHTRTGVVAADPRVLPVGSVVQIIDGATAGVYTVLDTGAAVKGRKIDIFIPDCRRARRFGAQTLRVRVLRRGWDPKSAPEVVTEWR